MDQLLMGNPLLQEKEERKLIINLHVGRLAPEEDEEERLRQTHKHPLSNGNKYCNAYTIKAFGNPLLL